MRLTNSVMISVACLGFFTTLPTTAWANEPDKVSDEWCGVSLAVPKPWARAAFKGYAVPGVLRCAWAGKGTSSLLVFVQEPGTAVDPRAMLDASTAAQKAKLGAEVIAQEIRTVGGMRAMWMAVKGKGTGGAIDGRAKWIRCSTGSPCRRRKMSSWSS